MLFFVNIATSSDTGFKMSRIGMFNSVQSSLIKIITVRRRTLAGTLQGIPTVGIGFVWDN